MKKIINYIKNPRKIMLYIMNKNYFNMFNFLNDKKYLEIQYKLMMKENPQTFDEKSQWLKLYDRKQEYTQMTDKYEVKKYISQKIGNEYTIPTIGIYDKFEDINFEKLPDQFVIKCTHDSGGVVICKDKKELDIKKAEKKIKKSMKKNYYYFSREWSYKNIKPRIIIEKYIVDESKTQLKDYKFYCFNGKVKMILVCTDRFTDFKETFFDENWNKLNLTEGGNKSEEKIEKPINFNKMKELSEKLSKNIPFVRVDLYSVKDKIFFGEFTFYSSAGYEKFTPKEYNKKLGDMIILPKKERDKK